MSKITDNTTLRDLFLRAIVKQDPFGSGEKKLLFEIPSLPDYLLAAKEKTVGSFLKKLRSSTALTPSHFEIPSHNLPLFAYGQAVLTIPNSDPETPTLGIHTRVKGETLKQFYADSAYAAKFIMGGWPQRTFNHLMRNAKYIEERGHRIDGGVGGNLMVWDEDDRSPPKFTHIDPIYNVSSHLRGSADVMCFFKTTTTGDNPPALLEKLFVAAEKTSFGVPEANRQKAEKTLAMFFKPAEVKQITQRLFAIPAQKLPENVQYTLPPEIAKVSAMTKVGLDSTLGELREYLLLLREADKKAYPEFYR